MNRVECDGWCLQCYLSHLSCHESEFSECSCGWKQSQAANLQSGSLLYTTIDNHKLTTQHRDGVISMDSTPVIDLTAAGDSPPPHQQQAHPPPSSSSSSSSTSSSDAPLVARSLTAARNSSNNNSNGDARNVNAVAGGSGSTLARRVPYPTNAASTPIDLTDDDIEYLGEHRLNLPQPHASGSDARPVPGDNYSLMGGLSL